MTEADSGHRFTQARRAVIAGSGSMLPDKVLTNYDLEHMVDTSDEWITTRTGIKERRIAGAGESTATLALGAARRAVADAGIAATDIDLIVCATVTPEMVFPATACFVQDGLGCRHCAAFDLSAACSGFTYGVATASSFIVAGQCDTALVMGAETLSRITNYRDRGSCIIFGDGAGAVVLRAAENTESGVLYSRLHADGSGWETLNCQAYGSRFPVHQPLPNPDAIYMEIRGRETYQLAVRRIVELTEAALNSCGLTCDDVDMIIPHQMNARIIESVVKRLNIPAGKMFVNIDRFGNTSSASIPIALDEARRTGQLKVGDLVLLVAFGAGLTWAVNLVRM